MKSILRIGGKVVSFGYNPGNFNYPYDDELFAVGKLHSILTGLNAFYATENRLPLNQIELSEYVDFNPSSNYTYAFVSVNSGVCYWYANTTHPLLYSYTRTLIYDGMTMVDNTCKRNTPGYPHPDIADYDMGTMTLTCKINSNPV